MKKCLPILILIALNSVVAWSQTPVPVLVISTFEVGKDTGDRPGEFQYWAEREKLTTAIPVPGVDHPIMTNGKGLYGMVSGTTMHVATQIMALGLSGKFDLSKTYILINGIAGVDPEDATVGSAAWANYVVDGDMAHEIDSQEIPKGWPYGILPLTASKPNEKPKEEPWLTQPSVYRLNPSLVKWAYQLSKDVELMDSPAIQELRKNYVGFPKAQAPPRVLIGDAMGSNRYWHGAILNRWANDWIKLWTNGRGNFVMTAMEEHGIMSALARLEKIKKVDTQRVLLLRTGSNFSMPYPGQAVDKSMKGEYAGYIPSLEAAYRAGSPVVKAWLEGKAP